MHIIKLNAIESTNTFLKEMVRDGAVEDYTIVTAENQFSGRGQMGATWSSEEGKNLMFSMFVKFENFQFSKITYLNYAVALGVFETLKTLSVPKLKIKWPNDIMSGNSKIGGILIENSLKKEYLNYSIVGVGLNVNQQIFPKDLPFASSLINAMGVEIDKEQLFEKLLEAIQKEIEICKQGKFSELKERYLSVLYKKDIPAMFEDATGQVFMGKIMGVSEEGNLCVSLENETVAQFRLKEIKMLFR